ncbi:MAG TPA: calcium-binding EGF-like domain-containing protein [Myxococcota bacterium]|nr:calcium-binding EGF-like domain-containing protein [Myxococcota bacterium]
MNKTTLPLFSRYWLCAAFLALSGSACSNGSGGKLLPVGSACAADAECAGPGTPQCLTDGLYPLAALANSSDPTAQGLAGIGVDLPGGYCSTVPPCATDADCGAGGNCFFPLRNVDREYFNGLVDALGLSPDDAAVVAGFIDYGRCLRSCGTSADCVRDGYVCATPIDDFLSLVDGADMGTFCVGEPAPSCDPNPCAHGTCSLVDGATSCECDAGWEGELCDVNHDDCDPNPCQNGGSCTDGLDSYSCACAQGYSGTNCENQASGCDDNPCLHGSCTDDGAGGYSCGCDAGWEGANCDSDVADCAADPCVHGTCTEGAPGTGEFSCACEAGWEGDDCASNRDDCNPNPCRNGGSCTDGIDSYSCSCQAGYTGTNCENLVSGCADNPCVHGICQDTGPGTYNCTCDAGWEGVNCDTDIPDCAANPCVHGTCSEGAAGTGEFSCACDGGWEGSLCDVISDLCTPNPCLNGGSCSMSGPGVYVCACVGGYSGTNCEIAPTTECVLTYDLLVGNGNDGNNWTGCNIRIRDTFLGMGDDTHAIGPGLLKIRVPSDGGQNPAAGLTEVLYYQLAQEFTTVSAGTTIITDVDGFSPVLGQTDNTSELATGSLTLGANSEVAWDACDYPAGYNDANDTFTPDVVGTGPGCLDPYRSVGNVNCSGSFCGAGGLNNGDNPQDETWEQALSTLSFSSDLTSLSMDFMLVPNRSPSRTYISVEGTLTDISCQ